MTGHSFLQIRLGGEDQLEDNEINPRFDLDVSINPEAIRDSEGTSLLNIVITKHKVSKHFVCTEDLHYCYVSKYFMFENIN